MTTRQFGVDLGGTKTELIVLDENGTQLFRQRIATPSHSYVAILDTICRLVRLAERCVGPAEALGIGAPGTPDGNEGRIKNANTTCLIGQPLALDLAKKLDIPVAIENDANCLALSEAMDGAAAGAHSVFGVILGTGVGGALVVNGQLINGPNRITGEWGHMPLPRMKTDPVALHGHRRCYCGLDDCVETYLSGQGLSVTYQRLRSTDFTPTSAQEIASKAKSGDARAQRAMSDYVDQLAASLAVVINIVDPDIIVFGGGLSQIANLCDHLHTRLVNNVFSPDVRTKLVTAMHGDSSGVRGAAWLTKNLAR